MRSLYAYIQKYYLYLCSGAVLLCLCHHDTCHSRSCIRAGGAETELTKIPVTLAMSTKPQSVMAQIGERTFQAMKQERAVETCSQLKQGNIH